MPLSNADQSETWNERRLLFQGERFTTSEDVQISGKHVPGVAKAVIILQTIVILYFSFWTIEEYLNNQYFRGYVDTTLAGGGFGIIAMSTIGVFSAIASGLYMKLRHTRRELEQVIGADQATSNSPGQGAGSSVLAPHVQQHLIEMIRKSTPQDATTSSGMPVLKREDQPSGQAK